MIWKGIIRTKRNEIDKGRNVILLYHMNMIIGFVAVPVPVPVRIELIESDYMLTMQLHLTWCCFRLFCIFACDKYGLGLAELICNFCSRMKLEQQP